MIPSSVFKSALAGLALALAGSIAGAATAVPDEVLDSAVLSLLAHQAANSDGGPLVLEQPQRRRHELGAVIDPKPNDGGLPRVMAITPGGAAERMGLRAGDRLLEVNGNALAANDAAGSTLRDAVQAESARLDLRVLRGSAPLALQGAVDRIDIPAYRLEIAAVDYREGCGRISVSLKPPTSEKLYPLLLHEVDGRSPGPLNNEVYRLSAGRHVLKVSELIEGRRFTALQNRRRSELMRHERFKYLEIEVEPDTTYRLGVSFDETQREPIREQRYWEPVVWKQVSESCR